MHTQVDAYLDNTQQWKVELTILRGFALDCGLREEFKWSQPCYSLNGRNIAIISGFKNSCVVSFFKGALLSDEAGYLTKPGDYSQSVRFFRFTDQTSIVKLEPTIKAYLFEAIEIERAGLKVEVKDEVEQVKEITDRLKADTELRAAFEALTPGRQRAYHMHFASAKQAKTRASRVDKVVSRIKAGYGITDCTCGLSQRMPQCDGSHRPQD